MFNWLLGGNSEIICDQDDPNVEVPDTPAPVFVARAFKSALFGTPAPPERRTIQIEKEPEHTNKEISSNQTGDFSPKKNSGILMTPGAVTPWRKTVSFDGAMLENEKGGNPDARVETSDKTQESLLENPRLDPRIQNKMSRKTTLTMQLENARERKRPDQTHSDPNSDGERHFPSPNKRIELRTCSESKLNLPSYEDHKRNVVEPNELNKTNNYDNGDTTVDLNKPFSESGIFWKSEFENYQREARLEIRKLLAYKEQAKTHTKLQNEQVKKLTEKLNEEQRKVIFMEEKISKLSSKIEASNKNTPTFEDESSNLIKELSRQTARAVQYEEVVEEFRKLMKQIEPSHEKDIRERSLDLSSSDTEPLEGVKTPSSLFKIKKKIINLKKKLQEVSSLELENKKLRKSTQQKDNTISTLKNEKEELSQKILRLESQCEKHGNNNLSHDEYYKNVTKVHEKLQENFEISKNKLMLGSAEFGYLPKKINDRKNELMEIARLINSEENSMEPQSFRNKKLFECEPSIKSNETYAQTSKISRLEEIVDNTPQLEAEGTVPKTLLPGSSANSSKTIHDSDDRILRSNQTDLLERSLPFEHPSLKCPDKEFRFQSCREGLAEETKYIKTHDESQKKPDLFEGGSLETTQNVINDLPDLLTHDNRKYSTDSLRLTSWPKDINPSNPNALQNFEAHRNYSSKNNFERKFEGSNCYSRLNKTEDKPPRISLPPERIEAAKQRLAAKKRQNLNLAGSISMNKT